MEIKSPDAKFAPEDSSTILTAETLGPSPSFIRRHLSIKKRLTRIDFLLSLLFFAAGYAVVFFLRTSAVGDYGIRRAVAVVVLVLFMNVILAATKRCRDAGMNPWWAAPCLIFTPGILVLLFEGGTVGPNRFGPDPRGRSKEPTQNITAQRASRVADC
jgi:uncharacterized membrane protein YhaH (DUF805 family)